MQELRNQNGTNIINTYMVKPKSFKKVLVDIHE